MMDEIFKEGIRKECTAVGIEAGKCDALLDAISKEIKPISELLETPMEEMLPEGVTEKEATEAFGEEGY